MESIFATIKLVGLAGMACFILYMAYLFYDKNILISIALLILGICLSIYITVSEIEFKRQRHKAPWLYERYKGE